MGATRLTFNGEDWEGFSERGTCTASTQGNKVLPEQNSTSIFQMDCDFVILSNRGDNISDSGNLGQGNTV